MSMADYAVLIRPTRIEEPADADYLSDAAAAGRADARVGAAARPAGPGVGDHRAGDDGGGGAGNRRRRGRLRHDPAGAAPAGGQAALAAGAAGGAAGGVL